MNAHGDSIDPAAYSVADLRANLFGETSDLPRLLAVMLLAGKRYAAKVADMKGLLTDEAEAPRVRVAAAQVLAQTPTPEAARALHAGLRAKDPLALRGVVKGLALRGERSALPAIARLARGQGPQAATAAWAARLLRYRFGQGGSGLPEAGPLQRPDFATATPIVVRAAGRTTLAHARRMLAGAAPGFAFSGSGALTFVACEDRRLMLLLDRESMQEGLVQRMLARRAVIGVIAEHSDAEGDAWEIAYFVMTEPRRGEYGRMSVVTSQGRLVLDGVATIVGGVAEFELISVDGPGAVPMEVVGTVSGTRVNIHRALISPTRAQPLVPVRLRWQPA